LETARPAPQVSGARSTAAADRRARRRPGGLRIVHSLPQEAKPSRVNLHVSWTGEAEENRNSAMALSAASNLTGEDGRCCGLYLQLTQIEAAFRTPRASWACGRLSPVGKPRRSPHPVAFLAYALSVTLGKDCKPWPPASPHGRLGKLATIQMLDVCLPTTDGLADHPGLHHRTHPA